MNAYEQLEKRFDQLSDLDHLNSLASWDEQVMMPPGGGKVRQDALATLQGIQHQLLSDPKVGDWILAAKELTLNEWQIANLAWMKKKHRDATCLPQDLVEATTKATLAAQQAWRVLRKENNWTDFQPLLQTVFDLTQEGANRRANALGLSAYDVLIDDFCPGEAQASIDPVFSTLQTQLPALITQAMEHQRKNTLIRPQGPFPVGAQRQLGLEVMRILTFDFNNGRLDESHHPFCGGSPQDVRITTRYNPREFISSLMGICHETGHAKYEQQLPPEWLKQPVGRVHCMAKHESQSLLVEMQVCRTLEFMTHLEPLIKQHFGDQPAFTASNLYHLYTEVQPSFIRVDADEVCYPLHVILRYEIEKQLFQGKARISDLPELWNHYMTQFFGLSTRGNDANGVLQDVHWPSGAFGYFPAYTLGRLIAAQLFQQAKKDHPHLLRDIQEGNCFTLFSWLKENVHRYAGAKNSQEILLAVTGEPLSAHHFLNHIHERYLS